MGRRGEGWRSSGSGGPRGSARSCCRGGGPRRRAERRGPRLKVEKAEGDGGKRLRASREEKKKRAIGPPNGKRRASSIRPPRSPFLSTSPGKRGEHGVESLSGERTVQEGTEDAREWALQKLQFVSVAATANIVFELSCFALRRPPCLRRAARSKTGPHQGRRGGHEGSEEERDEKGGPHFFALSPLFFLGGGELKEGSDQEREGRERE